MSTTVPLVLGADGLLQQLQSTDVLLPLANWPKRLAATTFAALPAASSVAANTQVRVTDVGLSGSEWFSDTVIWRPIGGRVMLARSNVNTGQTVTGTTTETLVKSITILPNLMGATGIIEGYYGWSYTNSANVKNARVRFNTVSTATGSIFASSTATTTLTETTYFSIRNRNATNSQTSARPTSGGWGSSATALIAGVIDTTKQTYINMTATLTLSSESMTLETYEVELIIP